MREPGEVVSAAFPRPGRALKAVLVLVGAFAIIGAIVWNWAPGPPRGAEVFRWLAFDPQGILSKPWMAWTLVTSGVLTDPTSFGHALWSLVGLYFLSTDLEKKWGGARLLRFFALSVVMGNLFVLAVDRLLPMLSQGFFHPGHALGPTAAITATAMAWAKENEDRQFRFMFVLPMKGKTLYWITIGFAVLSLIFMQSGPEGGAAPFGGIAAGLVFGGTPSTARSLWMRIKLAVLRRKGTALTVESMLDDPDAPRSSARGVSARRSGKGGPALRIVQGGADDDLKNRKPPKDKRYLN
ncbi:MAG TPA: rhomboid family intramembrane serine protease [Labilithrix sp.]|jgi:membrane associated rhomboid family serine protease|nr:rhomboid family intramembrane serine protease [Labilithrix sp.]